MYMLMNFHGTFLLNVLLHISQQYGRSPVCTRWWIFRLCLWRNVLLHTSQQYGCSPVWTRWWTFRLLLSLNVLLHTSQRHEHSLLSIRWCNFRCLWCLNVLLHTSQRFVSFTVCNPWRCSIAPCSLYVSFNVSCYKEKKEVILLFSKGVENIIKSKLYITYTSIISQDTFYQIPSSTANVGDYGMLTIHESNTPFPVTRQYFRMMCYKDILQLFFENLN